MAERQRQQSDLASVMWPALSREAKAQEARQARVQAEQKARNKRTAENLQQVIDSLQRERER
jgi:Skp family chaperone for outer membrane proteins